MSISKKLLAAAGAVVLSAGLGVGMALTTNATTLTCTNIASATTSPFGCGGLQSSTTAHGTLDLAHMSNTYNAFVTVQADASTPSEDWTAFAVNGLTTGGPGNLGRYVAMDTPNGLIATFTPQAPLPAGDPHVAGVTLHNAYPFPGEKFLAGPNDLCLSVEHVALTPGKLRWWNVLRSCNTNGVFTYGTSAGPGSVSWGFANAFQVWAPIVAGNGFLMDNVWLRNHDNVNYVLDITAGGGAGTRTQAYPENDQLNQQWGIIGCTPPANQLSVQTYVNCP